LRNILNLKACYSEIYYEGDVPILELEGGYRGSFAHGYLLGKHIDIIRKRWDMALHKIMRLPRADKLPQVLDQVKRQIPQKYLDEMQGLVDGFNRWGQERCFCKPSITLDELVLMHLLPDSLHFQAGAHEKAPMEAVACTVVADRDEEEDIVVGRNMDWMSLGENGRRSLVIKRKTANGITTAEVGVPGLIGTLTGINSHGLAVMMNVAQGDTQDVSGMPSCIFNRKMLDECITLKDTEAFPKSQAFLGPYHLTVADGRDARTYHLLQGDFGNTVTRKVTNTPLVTTNATFRDSHTREGNVSHSFERQDGILAHFEENAKKPKVVLVEEALSEAPHVNNLLTTHSAVFYTSQRDPDGVLMKVSFDNSFAAGKDYRTLTIRQLFG